MSQENYSVLLFGGENRLGLPVVRCLGQEPGLTIHYAAKGKTGTRFSRYLSSYSVLSGKSDDELLLSIKKIIQKTGSDVLLPIDEPAVEFMIKYKKEISDLIKVSPLSDLKTLHQVIDKNALNEWLEENDLPFANTWNVPTKPDELLSEALTFPILFKPFWDRGGDAFGISVKMFKDRFEMDQFLEDNPIDPKNYLLQEYIPGFDIDCSLLCDQGEILAYTLQKGFILQDLQFSPGIELLHDEEFLEQIKEIIQKLNWSGVCHLDFRYDERENTYKLVDFNARYWTTMLGSLVAGVNFPLLACKSALEESFPVPDYDNSPFVLTTVALKEMFRSKKGRSYTFRQTGLYYALKDPLPELFKFKGYD